VDWEVELAAVIGRKAKDVPVEKALACVAGYTNRHDLSARDAMRRDKNPPTSPFHYDWVSQKCFGRFLPARAMDRSGGRHPRSPSTGDQAVGERRADAGFHTSKLIFDTAEQIAMLSSRVTLHRAISCSRGPRRAWAWARPFPQNPVTRSGCGSRRSAS